MAEAPAAGWYVIRRAGDGAVSCLYTAGDGWWAMCGRNCLGLPPGWSLGPSLDELLDIYEARLSRARRPRQHNADPREIDGAADGRSARL